MTKTESSGDVATINNEVKITPSKEDVLKEMLLDKLLTSVSNGIDPKTYILYSEIYKNIK